MSQFPHDEFDDVAPYSSGEAGKHRAYGAYPAGGGAAAASGASGPMKWIGLAAAVVLVAVVAVYLILPLFGSDEDPEAGQAGDQDEVEEQEPGDDAEEGAADDEAEGEAAEDEAAPEEEEDAEDAAQDEEEGVDLDTPVRVANAGAPDWSASDVNYRLAEQGFNVTGRLDWEPSWGEVGTPVVFYPEEGQAEFAQEVAEAMGFENTSLNPAWETAVIVVGLSTPCRTPRTSFSSSWTRSSTRPPAGTARSHRRGRYLLYRAARAGSAA
ncbi:LytR C-terminal domain-containing protein [Nesterenkonia sp. NBAIMH1]|uniref:LytR C-terminal domain-containing protein n=1 Tax=Nesterenkonia sp. NBAIMH1 TaxID=2600320 RepID=UPI0011B8384C|nr:LytR C-terminal domain-containing protein [Nesterenkonia sp. NBAIMH1]